MNKDHGLEQLLRSMGQDSIERPANLEAETLEKMRPYLTGTTQRRRGMKSLGIVAAAALFVVGIVGTWSLLTWFSGPVPGAGHNIDLSADNRILAAQEKVDFDIVLPTWIPRGFSLGRVETSATGDSLTMIFYNSNGLGSLTIQQSPYLNHIFPAEIECVDFIMPDVANDPIDGYLYEIFADPERLLNRNLFFYSGDVNITVTSWGMELDSTALPQSQRVLDKDTIVEVARQMVGTKEVELIPPQDIYQLPRQWGGHIPLQQLPGFEYQSARIVTSQDSWSVQTFFSPGGAVPQRMYFLFHSSSQHMAEENAELIEINGINCYLSADGDELKLTFPTPRGTGEVHSVANSLTREELLTVAQWVINPQIITINISDLAPTEDYCGAFVEMAAGDVPFIELWKIIELDFASHSPDSVQVLDHLLTLEGNPIYTEREVMERPVEFCGDKVRFPLERHFATSLSSQYPPPPSLRGFRIICTWGEETREYALVIRTDQ